MSVIAFTKVASPYGWLGNMSPHPVVFRGVRYRTTEALFQCLRFPNDGRVQRGILGMKSPMGAKMHAKRHRTRLKVSICDAADLKRMALCLRLKCEQHPELRAMLVATGRADLIEDCTARPRDVEIDGKNHAAGLPFWGARWNLRSREWDGVNALGKLWMELRSAYQKTLVVIPCDPPSFIACLYSPEPMKTFELLRASYNKGLAEVAKLEALYNKIDVLVKKAGFANFEAYVAKISPPVVAANSEKPAVTRSGKSKSSSKKASSKAKRPPISDAKLAEMKELDGKKVPLAKIAAQTKVSVQSVYNWKKKGFKRST